MFQSDAQEARGKVATDGHVSMRWIKASKSFVPDRLVDRHILTLYGIQRKHYRADEIDFLLHALSQHDLGLETIGYEEGV